MLSDVVAAVRADFLSAGNPASVLLGVAHIAEEAAAGRVVFIPTDDTYGPRSASGQGASNPRSVLSRIAGAEVRIWAAGARQVDPANQPLADLAALDVLINATIMAIHRATPGCYSVKGGSNTQTTAHLRYGLEYVLQVEIATPVFDVPWGTIPSDTKPIIEMQWQLPDGSYRTEFADPEPTP